MNTTSNSGSGEHAPCTDGMRKKVLIVDDLAESAETLQLILEMDGYVVEVAREGQIAIKLAADFRPDVIILDIGMPGMDGYEVARRLRAQPQSRAARLLALTGYGDVDSRSRTRAAGFDHHVVKPADIDQLIALVAAD
ncbi:MAG: response regulator [Burkholderiaceae bacterium]